LGNRNSERAPGRETASGFLCAGSDRAPVPASEQFLTTMSRALQAAAAAIDDFIVIINDP
jgi:hypothetical protein